MKLVSKEKLLILFQEIKRTDSCTTWVVMRALTSLCDSPLLLKDHRNKVILRGSQQVLTENEDFSCHAIMLFVVGDSSEERKKGSSV